MRPRRTHRSNRVLRLPGGTEDNDLWVEDVSASDGSRAISTVWVPDEEERRRIAEGENVELMIWSSTTFPVAVIVTDVPLGKRPE